ncbi:MAG: class I SAM-dependent methyltransferase [Candidatus Aenigmarchaeota archaeon]|nr:class I SAM-dependent methyltransferase [Candidatus Aenigmarchaeota archaeon]
MFGPLKGCQICSSKNLETIISLGHQPVVQQHLTPEKLREPETAFPLNWCRCNACGLVQIDYIIDPKLVFHPEYPYQTGMTKMLVDNFRELASLVIGKYNLSNKDLVIDIGSNDGTLLQGFKAHNIRVLGVEPTKVAHIARKNGIPTVNDFFSEKTAKEILEKYGQAKIITATNMFAHVNNLQSFLHGVSTLLSDGGVFITESQYLMDIVEKLEFDTIYHEHLRFYSVKSLVDLHRRFGFTVVDAERISSSGGSIRVFAMKGKKESSPVIQSLIEAEEKAGLHDRKTFEEFRKRLISVKHKILQLLVDLKNKGNRIVGIGAPARASTILGFFNLDSNLLDYICERKGSLKIGLYTPGTHVPIVDEEKLFQDQPEYAMLLSWHIADGLIKKLKENGFRGKFIVPLPEPKIVG